MYNPIDPNHIFNDYDILDEWILEGEEPILSSDNLDWLDQDLPSKEGRETTCDDNGGTSYRVSRRGSSIVQGRDIGSSRKGKAPRIIFSSSRSDDGDDRVMLKIVVMLIKLIMTCRGHREMKIIMPHKILILDIG